LRKEIIGLVGISLAAGLAAGGGGLAAASPEGGVSPPAKQDKAKSSALDLPNPLEEKRLALRDEALKAVLKGESKIETINGIKVMKVGRKQAAYSRAEQAQVRAGKRVRARMVDQYVELSREQTDKIFVVLTEFSNTRATDIDPRYGDRDTDPDTPGPSTFEGPLRNAIPEPDRSKDNRTIWQPDYSADYYRRLYFGKSAGVQSLKTYYEKQSSGRYSVEGMVTDWVKVKYNEARYGRSDGFPCASNVCSNTWELLADGLTQWVADQKAKGQTDTQVKAGLASYDQQDRYDYDGDGNFGEADGYIDHFQIVHAGGDQADGDPNQGEDAIWSHRGYAFEDGIGTQGPAGNPLGGTQIGDTGLWVADYTIQPENGGLSVFAHEYGHDIGLPDLYNTAGGGDNGVDWWSSMAQYRARARNDLGVGTRPADLGAWEKLQLGWLDYEIAVAGQKRTYNLGPHEYNSRKAQALAVVLPDKEVVTDLVTPASGTKRWWSGTGDDLDNSLTRRVTLPAGPAQLTFRANYDIEDCGPLPCDYAYVQVDDGTGFTAIPGSITKPAEGNGIDGPTGGKYVPATFDLSAYAGKTVDLRFRYFTDAAVAGNDANPDGFFVDDIAITAGGTTVFSDNAEAGAAGWTAVGFSVVGASVTSLYDNFYLASYRSYTSYDRYLKTGPYNFGFGPTLPDKVEYFPYQEGLLINYWDDSQADNNTSEHPGKGLVLPVDARPAAIYNLQGQPWRGRIQVYDAPFSRRRADSFTLNVDGRPSYIRGAAAQPVFDDRRSYRNTALPNIGVDVPKAGVTMRVVRQGKTSMKVRLGSTASTSPASVLNNARAGNEPPS
jgi:immune inhibitor A